MAQEPESEDVVVMGWLRGEDYEAALAYRRRGPGERSEAERGANQPPKHPTLPPPPKHQALAGRLVRRTP